MRFFLILFFVMMGLCRAHAQTDTLEVGKKPRRWSILPVPAFGYEPETKGYIGAVCLTTFKLGEADERSSNAQVEFNYTQRKQIISYAEWNINGKLMQWISNGFIGYQFYPDFFWGVGSTSKESMKEAYENKRWEVDLSWTYRLSEKPIFIGPQFIFQKEFDISSQDEDGLIFQGDALGTEGYQLFGIGVEGLWDSRDHILNTRKGAFISLDIDWMCADIREGEVLQYPRVELDARKYMSLHQDHKHLLAFQFRGIMAGERGPLNAMALLGSSADMRGYYHGRYRDQHYYAFQSEYRFWAIGRFGGVVFAGFGDVFHQKFTFKTVKPSVGTGLRFLIDRQNDTNLRLDYAWGKASQAFYIGFGEAF